MSPQELAELLDALSAASYTRDHTGAYRAKKAILAAFAASVEETRKLRERVEHTAGVLQIARIGAECGKEPYHAGLIRLLDMISAALSPATETGARSSTDTPEGRYASTSEEK